MARGGGKKRTAPSGGSHQSPNNHRRTPKLVETVDDEDDEEIDEDEAFNSEDERMYGHFFTTKKTREENDEGTEEVTSDEDVEDDDDDEEGSDDDDDDDGQYMLSLLEKLDSAGTKANNATVKQATAAQMAKLPESEYSSTISKKGLTLDNLMQGLEDTQGFKNLQKAFAKQETATPAPLDKVLADRIQRKIAYENQSKDISRWGKVVQENRQAETLDFKPKERLNITRDTLVDKFEPTTDFEKELEQALEEAGQQDEEAVLKAEEQALQDDLGANRLTMEEYKKRHGQLAQLRALMFYHEQKRHHIKKIKSKKYRKIRKKQRERLKEADLEVAAEADAELAQELKDKEETARIQERMTLAHKNTSKWAKRVLKRGKNVDIETRRALSAQIQRGDDLRRKMMGDDNGDSNSDSDEDLAESARKILQDDGPDPKHGKSGLFKLSFMQKGLMSQRDKAREEARRLLSELQDESGEFGDGAWPTDGGSDDIVQQKKEVIASDQEMKKILKGGELVASSLVFGNSTSISTSGGIEIDLPGNKNRTSDNGKKQDVMSGSSEHVATFESNAEGKTTSSITREKEIDRKGSTPAQKATPAPTKKRVVDDEPANPWLPAAEQAEPTTLAITGQGGAYLSRKKKATKGMVDVEGAADILDSGSSDAKHVSSSQSDPKEDAEPNKKITMLSQEELIRRAFATQSDKEIEEEFRKEKEMLSLENDPTRKVADPKDSKEVSGWGSWTGVGAPPPSRPRKLPKKLEPPKKKKEESRKRKDAGKPDVIVNQKRLKKMASNYMLGDVPHPYSSRIEYEQAMLGGVGLEWNVTTSFKNMTRPEILTRSGKIIQPISKKAKVVRAPAKF